ncbi:MAG: DUF3617 family protein [Betaproteobacteria bacterium]|nr:DUF3617 family protein [Betaproteobacteria bacterium]
MYRTLAALALLYIVPAHAQDIAPGLWQITMETRVSATPGFTPAPYTLNQCLTAADARDPSRVLGGVANPGATGCTYTDKGYSGNTFRFTMQCAGTFGIRTRGEVSFSADSLDGTISASADVGGQKVEFGNRIRGKRVGGC